MAARRRAQLAAAVIALWPSPGWAAGGDLLWEKRGQQEPYGEALDIAAASGVVVGTGYVCPNPTTFECHWFVRAHLARDGRVLWEDRRRAVTPPSWSGASSLRAPLIPHLAASGVASVAQSVRSAPSWNSSPGHARRQPIAEERSAPSSE